MLRYLAASTICNVFKCKGWYGLFKVIYAESFHVRSLSGLMQSFLFHVIIRDWDDTKSSLVEALCFVDCTTSFSISSYNNSTMELFHWFVVAVCLPYGKHVLKRSSVSLECAPI